MLGVLPVEFVVPFKSSEQAPPQAHKVAARFLHDSVMAGSDSLTDTILKGIFDTGDGHQGHVAGEVLIGKLIGGMEFGTSGGPVLKIPAAECDSPQHLVCIEDDCP